jgi:hypothetical protein
MGSRLRIACVVALAATLAAPALAAPTAAEKETARNLMDEGHHLRDDQKDPASALARFKAADQIMHVPTTTLEVATTQVQLGRLVEARETLAHLLSSPAKAGDPQIFQQARAKAQALDDSLAGRIATLVVTVHGDTKGAEMKIDGVRVPATLIGLPNRANPGHHAILVDTRTMVGRAAVDLADGEKKEVTIDLKPQDLSKDDTPDAPPPVKEAPHHGGARVFAVVMFGVGGAALVAGGITGIMTFTTQSDLATKCPNNVCGPESHDELVTANTLATISTVSFVGAGVCAVAGLVSFLLDKPHAAPAQTGARLEPWVGVGAAGVRGTF